MPCIAYTVYSTNMHVYMYCWISVRELVRRLVGSMVSTHEQRTRHARVRIPLPAMSIFQRPVLISDSRPLDSWIRFGRIAAAGAMLTAMACCPLPTGRVGHGSAPWRVTDASEGPLLRCCEGAWGSQTRGATYPVACATILLVCLCAAHSVLPDPLTPLPRAARRSNRLLCDLTVCLPYLRG